MNSPDKVNIIKRLVEEMGSAEAAAMLIALQETAEESHDKVIGIINKYCPAYFSVTAPGAVKSGGLPADSNSGVSAAAVDEADNIVTYKGPQSGIIIIKPRLDGKKKKLDC